MLLLISQYMNDAAGEPFNNHTGTSGQSLIQPLDHVVVVVYFQKIDFLEIHHNHDMV